MTWEQAYAHHYIEVDAITTDAICDALEGFAPKLAGVTTYVEAFVPIVSEVCHHFHLPSIPLHARFNVRDKSKMRHLFQENNVPSPAWAYIHHEYDPGFDHVTYPAVIKPVSGWSSIGVQKVLNKKEAQQSYLALRHKGQAFMIEEYIEGPEFSIDGVIHNNNIYYSGITSKQLSPEPFFEEIGHDFPAQLEDRVKADIYHTTEKALSSLDIDHCPFHLEFRLTREGPVVIEVAGRLGGDCIPLITHLASGINLARESLKVCLGLKPDLTPNKDGYASMRIITPYKTGVLTEPPTLDTENIPQLHDLKISPYCQVGKRYFTPPDGFFSRLGYFIVRDDKQTKDLADELLDRVAFKIEEEVTIDERLTNRN
nr:ATP-grasp domain-containing protein [Caldalkalibacillus salinus]